MKTYSDKLKDPRWQRKKNSILERDNYQCRICAKKDKFVCVHHLYYLPDKDPWDYDDECFVTLCKDCHDIVHNEMPKIMALMAFQVVSRRQSYFDVEQALNIL